MTTFSPDATRVLLEDRLRRASTPQETRQTLSLWLCLVLRLPNIEVASMLGVSLRYVQRARATFTETKRRKVCKKTRKPLSRAEGLPLVLAYLARWKEDKTPLSSLQESYEEALGKKVSTATFHRFLGQYGMKPTIK
jgi:hypothetical protein